MTELASVKTRPFKPPLPTRPTDGWPDAASLAALRAWYEGLSSREAVHCYLAGARAPGQSSMFTVIPRPTCSGRRPAAWA